MPHRERFFTILAVFPGSDGSSYINGAGNHVRLAPATCRPSARTGNRECEMTA